jgi:REP element-mobilizing transposase RayT
MVCHIGTNKKRRTIAALQSHFLSAKNKRKNILKRTYIRYVVKAFSQKISRTSTGFNSIRNNSTP